VVLVVEQEHKKTNRLRSITAGHVSIFTDMPVPGEACSATFFEASNSLN
jgi:hypothetical protein